MSSEHEWFTHDRLGMFVHWGLYSVAARHEWVMSRERTAVAEYQRYAKYFDPDLYDPTEWAELAAATGMTYVVLTTKHHEGFCLWDSQLTDYKITNSPYGKDAVAMFVAAARAAGLRVGFYYSLIDWYHPDFTIDPRHPRRDDADAVQQNQSKDFPNYRDYLWGQVRELLTGYGKIDYMFYDFSYAEEELNSLRGKGPKDWQAEDLLALTRELQPGILVNDRLGLPADVATPEQYQPSEPLHREGAPVRWEACQTINGSWGYDRDNTNYKSPELLVKMLIDGVSKNGNFLLNIGPTARGTIDEQTEFTLTEIGEWMRLHSRSIYGAGAAEFAAPSDVRYTQRGDRLYVHVFSWPLHSLHLPGLAGKIEYAQLLSDASEIKFFDADPEAKPSLQNTAPKSQPAGTVTLTLPTQQPDVLVPVIECFLRSS